MRRAVSFAASMVAVLVVGVGMACAAGGNGAGDLEREIQGLRDEVSDLQGRIAELEASAEKATMVEDALDEMGIEALPNTFRLYWDSGVRARTTDDRVRMKVGGRFSYDWFWGDDGDFEDRGLNIRDSGEVRQGRLYWEGNFWESVKFRWEYDFAEGSGEVKDAYVELRNVPADAGTWHFRGGHFKEPFSLQRMTSLLHTTFMERAITDVFAPGRNPGFMIHGHVLEERMTMAAGIFKRAEADVECAADLFDRNGDGNITAADLIDCDVDLQLDDAGFSRDGDYGASARLTALPWYEEGKGLVHIGGSYSFTNLDRMYLVQPEARLAPALLATGLIEVDEVHNFGGEVGVAIGPFHCQGEYVYVQHELEPAPIGVVGPKDPDYSGWYAQAGFFLTGESRPYDTKTGTWGRVKPKKNYGEDGGYGAVEVAGRVSVLDLEENDFAFGEMQNWTAALNWYLNPNVILRLNYIQTQLEEVAVVDGDDSPHTDMIMMRLQVDF